MRLKVHTKGSKDFTKEKKNGGNSNADDAENREQV